MTLSPSERNDVLRLVAEAIVEEFREEAGGDLGALIVLPLQAAGAHLGLSSKVVAAKLPTVRLSRGKHGVRLKDLREFIDSRTSPPSRAGGRPQAAAGHPEP